jgi:hypothetical protein
MSKLAFRGQTVDIAYLPLHQDLLAKNVLMAAQRDFGLGKSLFPFDRVLFSTHFQNHFADKKPLASLTASAASSP